MLPGFLTRAIDVLLGRQGRSLHLRAAWAATAVLGLTALAGSWAVVAAEHGAPDANLTTYPRALWWSVETATTVGYGDFYPVTLWGRVIGAVVMVIGITTYGIGTAALATWFVGREEQRRRRLARAEQAARHMSGEAVRALHARFDDLERLLLARERPGSGPDDPGLPG
ncbi:potassium channel family protein [Streptomyces sp. NPDC052682]|uniref:potassium channel family protein n=1 Tax=Streptomyces sp. NPDC052682 TaxID=3154954 RepID=UPI00341A8890